MVLHVVPARRTGTIRMLAAGRCPHDQASFANRSRDTNPISTRRYKQDMKTRKKSNPLDQDSLQTCALASNHTSSHRRSKNNTQHSTPSRWNFPTRLQRPKIFPIRSPSSLRQQVDLYTGLLRMLLWTRWISGGMNVESGGGGGKLGLSVRG